MHNFNHPVPPGANESPTWALVAVGLLFFGFVLLIGTLFVVKGVYGIKNRRIRGKWGRVFEGSTAQVIGAIWIVLGVLVVVVPVSFWLLVFLLSHFANIH